MSKRMGKVTWGVFLMCVMVSIGSIQDLRAAAIPGGTLDPTSIPKYQSPLIIPPAMPRTSEITGSADEAIDYYEIAVRQFQQEILPASMGLSTTVWSYGSVNHPGAVAEGGTFNYPALTIEATHSKPVRVKWINDLVDEQGHYLSHILPVDQTLHWTNPPGGLADRDKRGKDPAVYLGPVPIVTHVHGAHTHQESDGYPEAWFLPAAVDIPASHAVAGTLYADYNVDFQRRHDATPWESGTATYQYPNDQRATTLWYHDHSLGMTRLNVYAGPAGFYIIRGGPDDEVAGTLPGPAPARNDSAPMDYFEIPIVIQDRSFNDDGSLFYPDNRAFFEGLDPDQLQIPFIPGSAQHGPSDVSPIWNPEFFGNTMVVNGRTWPYLELQQRRYRFRLLNGCNSRFLILKMGANVPFYQIGAEGGFLPAPTALTELLMAPAERADVIVDFTDIPVGEEVVLLNLGPDEPFGGGTPGIDFDPADAGTTGQVMQFKVVARAGSDDSTAPMDLGLPAIEPLGPADNTRYLTLNEEESKSVRVEEDAFGRIIEIRGDEDDEHEEGEVFGPTSALLGTLTDGPLKWGDSITEDPTVGDVEIWELHNFTEDAHPIHVHLVMFQVLGRGPRGTDPPESWETGWKDTVIAHPGEITRIKARFDLAGLYVWHCHIVEHEDNEMMRPYRVKPLP
ncbi:MAG: multicopper oxidase domain-containing protein [Phycisphaerales bacterium]|nr:MAG: multicopper oxidase domain-containing protein [Phycisphaerales bacterium]